MLKHEFLSSSLPHPGHDQAGLVREEGHGRDRGRGPGQAGPQHRQGPPDCAQRTQESSGANSTY